MRTGWLFCLVVGLAAALSACARPAPRGEVALVTPGPAQATVRTLSVVALADESWQRVPGFEARIQTTVADASAHLAARFGLVLDLRRVAPWDPPPGGAAALLAALEERRLAPAADLVIAFTAHPPPRRARMPDLARSRYADRYGVLLGLGRYHPDPRARRAAEAHALVHLVGRILGALPACGRGVMAERPPTNPSDPAIWRFGPTNGALVEAHLDLRLDGDDAGLRVGPDTAARARQALVTPGPDLRCDMSTVDTRRALLAAVVTTARAAEAAGELLSDAPGALTQREADQTAVDDARAALEDDPGAAYATCAPIADRDPALAARCAGRAAEALGRHDDAIRYLRAWLSRHPDDEDALLRLAREVGRDGDDAAARALLERAVADRPDFVDARLNLGIARARLGDYLGARAAWQAVLDRCPDHAEARRLLDQLPK